MKKTKILLSDADGVIFDWQTGFNNIARTAYPDIEFPFLTEATSWDLSLGLDEKGKAAVHELHNAPFYADLEPFEGAAESLNIIQDETEWEVFIVTSPYPSNPTCASDKLNSIRKHLGKEWGARTIITSDKTLVQGHLLIDDKPEIKGHIFPSWTQVLFDQPYNQGDNLQHLQRMLSWSEWPEVLAPQ